MADKERDYALGGEGAKSEIPAPALPYRPGRPGSRPGIGLIGCGGITEYHLKVYREAGFRLLALADLDGSRARSRRDAFYPDAQVYTDYRDLLGRDDIEVVDIATHPPERVPIIEDALEAGKHVLSQKPFVIDLDVGERLVDLAESRGLKLAVNQNGRWAPHFSFMRQAIQSDCLGEVLGVHLAVHWDHGWIADVPAFDEIHHVILYDFAIHWFDILACFLPARSPRRLFASYTRSPTQRARHPMLAQALVEFDGAQASLVFDADTKFGPLDSTYVAGTAGSLSSVGPNLQTQEVTLHTAEGFSRPRLEGTWFREGFLGTMSELLCAIEEGREPYNAARGNLRSLAMCFAACRSAETGQPVVPGEVRRMPGVHDG